MQHGLAEIRGLYRGVVGAASAAGIIIGTYFAFYSTTKNLLRRRTTLNESAPLCLIHVPDLAVLARCARYLKERPAVL